MADDLATLGLRVESQQVDQANARLDQFTQKAGQAKRATDSLAQSSQQAASQARQMADAIAQQEAVYRAQAAAQGNATAAVRGNASAVMDLGKQTSATAQQTRTAAIAHANVTNILGLNSKAAKGAAGDHQGLANALGLTAFQMRMIAIQAPDVVQGLMMGQRPLQVLIQQGGQIVQIMGMGPNGMGGALRALLALVGPLALFGAIAAVFGTLAAAVMKGRQEFAELNNALAVTNGYSGVTANNFESMARRIAMATDTTVGSTKKTITALIDQGQLSGETLQEAAAYAQKFAELTGQDASKVVASFASMRDGVTAFALKHTQQFHDLSQAQIDYIAKLESEGKWHDAELAYFRAANTAMQKHVVQYGYIETAVHKVAEAASGMWDALLGLGKPKTLDDQIKDLQGVLEKNAYGLRLRSLGFGVAPGMSGADIANTVDQMARLSFQKSQEQNAARPQADVGDPLAAQSQQSAQQAAVLQALAARAQAEAGLTADVVKQAELQKQALRYQTAADQARLQQQLTDLSLDKSLNDAQKGAIAGAMKRAAGVNAQVNADRARLIDLQTQDALVKQAADLFGAQNDAAASILQAQEAITTDIQKRALIETTLLNLADQKAIADAQAVIGSKLTTDAQKKAAQAQIDAINAARPYKQQLIDQQAMVDTIHQQAALAQTQLQGQADILRSQEPLLQYGFQRDQLNRQILAVEQQIAMSKAKEALAAAEAANDQAAIARARADLAALEKVQANQTKAAHDTFLQSYDKVSGSLDSMSSAFSRGDWVHATSSLFSAMGDLGNALGPNGIGGALSSFAAKMGPLGEMLALGAQIGMTVSPMIAHALGGNSQNARIGGIFGTIPGIIAGFFGESDASIQRRKDQNAAAAAAIPALQTRQQQAMQQEITLAQLTGDTIRATNLQRQQELNTLDAANRARQQQIYDLQDQADKAGAALQTAAQDMMGVYTAAKQASQSLATFYASLTTGSAAMNSPARQYMLTKTALVGINSRIAAGDQSAFGDVQNAVTAFLQAAEARAPNAQAYRRDLAFAEKSVADAKAAADGQMSIAQQQLDAAHAQVASIQTVNSSVLTVAQAVANLQAALTGQKAVQDQASAVLGSAQADQYRSTNGDFAAYVEGNPDLLALYRSGQGMARGRSETEFGMYHWVNYGQTESRPVRPFATGGAFTNGVVNQPTTFDMGLMGEAGPEAIVPLHRGADGSLGVRMAANDNGGWTDVLVELRAIHGEITAMRGEGANGWGLVKRLFDLFRRVSLDGDALQTELKVPA